MNQAGYMLSIAALLTFSVAMADAQVGGPSAVVGAGAAIEKAAARPGPAAALAGTVDQPSAAPSGRSSVEVRPHHTPWVKIGLVVAAVAAVTVLFIYQHNRSPKTTIYVPPPGGQ